MFRMFSSGAVLVVVVALALAGPGCADDGADAADPASPRDYRADMRAFVRDISAWAKSRHPGFAILPQNGHELATDTGDAGGQPMQEYLAAIDGAGQEDLFYGYDADDEPTPAGVRDYLLGPLNIYAARGIRVLVTDYASDHARMDDSYQQNMGLGFISFAADHRALDNVPGYPSVPWNVHHGDVTSLAEARNFLYLINPGQFADRQAYLAALAATDYDILLLDLFFADQPLTVAELAGLRQKAGGGQRLLICYMSIGEAEDYRWYWDPAWSADPPAWLAAGNPDWEGNYKVRYWDPAWQAIIFGSDGSYLGQILAAGFDGVYLDIIDAFEYFSCAQ